MKKLDQTDADLLGVFQLEKRKETGGVAKPTAPKPAPIVPPPVEDPQVAALRAQTTRQQVELERLAAELLAARHELAEAQALQDTFDRERRLADKRGTQARDRVRELEATLLAADKTPLWTDRGLLPSEVLPALTLLAAKLPQPLFDALMTTDPRPLARLLNDRLALVCRAPPCQPTGDTLALAVPVERCELCGGSDLRVAFRAFAQATLAAGLPSVTFIGGSPAYREALRQLHRELKPAFDLDAVGKKRPNEGKRAQAARGLIVIWGGSEVDHDTTIHYRQSGDLVLIVNHRGLSGILPRLTALLAKS